MNKGISTNPYFYSLIKSGEILLHIWECKIQKKKINNKKY